MNIEGLTPEQARAVLDFVDKLKAAPVQALPQRHCERCGHTWVARRAVIVNCPKCKSPYWDRPRQKQTEPAK